MNIELTGLPQRLLFLLLIGAAYAASATVARRRWGERGLLLFGALSAPIAAGLLLWRVRSLGGHPTLTWQALFALLVVAGAAGTCLRVYQVSRVPVPATFLRQSAQGCLGLAAGSGVVLLTVFLSDIWHLIRGTH